MVSDSVGMSLGEGETGFMSGVSCAIINPTWISKRHSTVTANFTFLVMVSVIVGEEGTIEYASIFGGQELNSFRNREPISAKENLSQITHITVFGILVWRSLTVVEGLPVLRVTVGVCRRDYLVRI